MNSAILDDRLAFQVVLVGTVLESFRGDGDNILLVCVTWDELRLDTVLPLVFHELLDACLTQFAPLSAQPSLANALKGLVDENTTA